MRGASSDDASWLISAMTDVEMSMSPGRTGPERRPRQPKDGENQLLSLLPPDVLERLSSHIQQVQLEGKEVLFRAHEPMPLAYFPVTAVVSLVARLETGEMLEVGLIGRDGVAGMALHPGATMTCEGVVQIPGVAWRIPVDRLRREMAEHDVLQTVICRFAQLLLVQSMQLAVCNTFHPVEQRCVRWLLMARDLVETDEIPLTHNLLATMLGVHRPTVTLVIGTLQRAGLIEERRGLLRIRNRKRLECACCECYHSMREEQRRVLSL